MKTISIKNLVIQFDSKGENPLADAQYVIDLINKTLQGCEFESQPQIMASGLDVSDLEMEDSVNDEAEFYCYGDTDDTLVVILNEFQKDRAEEDGLIFLNKQGWRFADEDFDELKLLKESTE